MEHLVISSHLAIELRITGEGFWDPVILILEPNWKHGRTCCANCKGVICELCWHHFARTHLTVPAWLCSCGPSLPIWGLWRRASRHWQESRIRCIVTLNPDPHDINRDVLGCSFFVIFPWVQLPLGGCVLPGSVRTCTVGRSGCIRAQRLEIPAWESFLGLGLRISALVSLTSREWALAKTTSCISHSIKL